MQFMFNGDISRPAVIAIEARTRADALAILDVAEKRGNLEDSRISVYDEDSDQRLSAFHWDGDETQADTVEHTQRLILVPNSHY